MTVLKESNATTKKLALAIYADDVNVILNKEADVDSLWNILT